MRPPMLSPKTDSEILKVLQDPEVSKDLKVAIDAANLDHQYHPSGGLSVVQTVATA